jgi:4-amino-4-deoxy-L-arabinose transferase-like glycosyltransferase
MQRVSSFFQQRGDLLTLLFLVLVIWLPRGLSLDQFVTPDEPLWLTRSANFYYALTHADLASTYQKEHPGVTTMWVGTVSFLLRDPEYRNSQRGQLTNDEFHEYMGRKARTVTPLQLLTTARALMVLAQVLILALSFVYARRLVGWLPAFLGFTLIAFDPFHIALTRLLHLDGLFSNLVLLSLLSFIGYLRQRRKLHLVISSLAAGLGWLTKTPALFLIPVVGLLVLMEAYPRSSFRDDRNASNEAPLPTIKDLIRQSFPLLIWLGLAAFVFTLLWPSMWVQPIQTLTNLYNGALNFAEQGHNSAVFFNGHVIPSGNVGAAYFYYYPLTYLWRSTPLVLLGLALALWAILARREPFDRSSARQVFFALVLLVLIFLVGFTISAKKFDRYLLPAYAPLDILAGMGWSSLVAVLASRRHGFLNSFGKYAALLVGLLVIALQAGLSLQSYPYYFTYYDPLMGGGSKAPAVMHVGWGEGLDQAARYLNQKPDAAQLSAISWGSTGCLSYFFKGTTRSILLEETSDDVQIKRLLASDYAVIYINQEQAQLARPVLDYVSRLKPEHTIWLNGIRYADIYKIH